MTDRIQDLAALEDDGLERVAGRYRDAFPGSDVNAFRAHLAIVRQAVARAGEKVCSMRSAREPGGDDLAGRGDSLLPVDDLAHDGGSVVGKQPAPEAASARRRVAEVTLPAH